MLIKFRVENFLSFYNKREFSMIAGKSRLHTSHIYENKTNNKFSLMKTSYIYGANASGKTNFIRSVNYARECVLKGISRMNTLEKTYKLDADSIKKPTQFEFEILIDNKVYAYGFSILLLTKEVLEEWLVEVKEDEDINLLNRKKNEVECSLDLTEKDKNRLNVYIEDLKSNYLLLEVLKEKQWDKKDYEFLKILKWLEQDLIIIFPNTSNYLMEYFDNKNCWLNYFEKFGIEIKSIDLGEREFEELPIPREIKDKISNDIANLISKDVEQKTRTVIDLGNNFLNLYVKDNKLKAKEILFSHKSLQGEVKFKFYEESDGTRRLLELLPLLERVKKENHTILIDELERSLHPLLSQEILKNFYKNMKETKSQLIITTHESRLLNLKYIRRDEVWFAENSLKEGTKLYSLEEFKTRFDQKLDKAYLIGRYGGIPNIKSLLNDSERDCDE